MPTTAETYRKTYAERHLERLRANYERAVEEWERGAAIDQREADWIEEQIKAQHDYVYRLKKAGIKSGDVASLDQRFKASEAIAKADDRNRGRAEAVRKRIQDEHKAPEDIMRALFTIESTLKSQLDIALRSGNIDSVRRAIDEHMMSRGVSGPRGGMEHHVGQRADAAIRFASKLNEMTGGQFPDIIESEVANSFSLPIEMMDPAVLKIKREREEAKAVQQSQTSTADMRALRNEMEDKGASPMDAAMAVDPQLKKAEDDLAALVERREALDSGREAPTEEELRARAVELTGPMLSRKARREKRARLLSGPSDEDKIIASLTARAETYLNETADPDEDHSEAGEMAIRLQDMMGSGALDPRDMMDRATEFAGNDMGYRDEIIMRVFAHDMARTRRKAYRDIPEQVGQEGPEFRAVDMEKLASTVEEVAPEQP